jgi:hypothetical protein
MIHWHMIHWVIWAWTAVGILSSLLYLPVAWQDVKAQTKTYVPYSLTFYMGIGWVFFMFVLICAVMGPFSIVWYRKPGKKE